MNKLSCKFVLSTDFLWRENKTMTINRLIRGLSAINEFIGQWVAFLIPLLGIILVYELIRRYVFNAPTIWVHDISQFVFGLSYMLGAGYTLLCKGHVNMDVLHSRLSKKGKAWTNSITSIFSIALVGVLVWKSGYMAWDSFKYKEIFSESGALMPPLWPMKILFFVGCLLFFLQVVVEFLENLSIAVSSDKVDELLYNEEV